MYIKWCTHCSLACVFFLRWSALILYLAILYVNNGLTVWPLQLQIVVVPNTASLHQLPSVTGYLSIDKGMFHFNKTTSNNCDGHNLILDWENLFRAKKRLKLLWFMFSLFMFSLCYQSTALNIKPLSLLVIKQANWANKKVNNLQSHQLWCHHTRWCRRLGEPWWGWWWFNFRHLWFRAWDNLLQTKYERYHNLLIAKR